MHNKIIHHYRIIKPLGAGAFGQTHLAQNLKLPDQPMCVVKQLKPQSTDPESVKTAKMLFDREAETLHQIRGHEQIPQILDYFEEDQEFYLVQEYIEGKTLREELDSQQPWDESQAILFLQEMLEIVAFLHSRKIIHRDIKPENIVRRTLDQKLFLIDFGAVKQACCDRQQSSTIIHSRGYSPPEQLAGIPEPNSDIYALGMTCIEVLTKAAPESLIQLRELRTQKISWSESLKIRPEFKSILDDMVCISAQNRYSSADCVLRDLERIATSSSNNYTPTEITTSHNLHAYTPTELRAGSTADSYTDMEDFEQLSEAGSLPKILAPPPKKKLSSEELSRELIECLADKQRAPQPKEVVNTIHRWLRKRVLIVSGSLIFTVVGLPLFLIFSHTNKSAHSSNTNSSETANSRETSATFEEKSKFKEHSSSIKFLAFAPDRKTLISGSKAGLVKLRDVHNPSLTTTLTQTQSQILAMSSSANGNTLAIATEGKSIELWDLKHHKKTNQILTQQIVWSLALSQYGDLAAGIVGKIKLWKIQPKLSETKQLPDERSQSIAFNPAADVLARGSADGTVRMFHLTSNKSQSFHKHSNAVNAVAIDVDGAILFTGSEDDTIRIWNLHALSEHTLPTIQADLGGVKAIASSPTAKIVAGGGTYGTVRIWNWHTGQTIASFSNHLTEVTALAFSPEGRMLAAGDREGGIVIYTLK